jgi:hypothetical protein
MVKLLVNGLEIETERPVVLYNDGMGVCEFVWIDVKESLSPNLSKVLFHYIIDEAIANIAMGFRRDDIWSIYLPYNSFELNPNTTCVTHWMPLVDKPLMVMEPKLEVD